MRNVDYVIDEIRNLKSWYPNLKSIRFRDESLTINKWRCIELCNKLAEMDLGIEFEAHSRLDGLDEEIIQYLQKAGFTKLYIGLESGSQQVLKRLKKGIDIGKAEEIVRLLRKYGIGVRISLLIATPNETFEESLETVKLIKRLRLKKDEFYVGSNLLIYPGTEDCSIFKAKNQDYKWIQIPNLYVPTYSFSEKYSADEDPYGNVITPKFREYSIFKVLLIHFLIGPSFAIRSLIRSILSKIFKTSFVFKYCGSSIIRVVS